MKLTQLFELFVAGVALGGVIAALRFLPKRYRAPASAAIVVWIGCAGALGAAGALANTALRPPGIVYIVLPTAGLIVFMSRSRTGGAVAASIPLTFLIGAQSMRFIVELFLDRLRQAGELPRMMTFHGANYDILIGVSAPVLAILYARRVVDARAILIWNVAGMASIANIVVRNVLASPAIHVLRTDVPNSAIGIFPFSFIPTFIVPLALLLHVLAVRALAGASRKPAPKPLNGRPLQVAGSRTA